MLLRDALQGLLFHSQAEGQSPRTAQFYQERLAPFVAFCEAKGQHELETCPKTLAWEYLARYPNVATRNATVRAIARLGRWALQEGLVDKAPIAGVKQAKEAQRLRATLTAKELTAFLQHVPLETKWRDQALALFLYDTGCRVSEALGLPLERLKLDQGYAVVRGKGNKERIVPFGARTAQALWTYLQKRRPAHPSVEEVFLTRWGRPMDAQHLASHFRRIAKLAGLEKANPHLFRHSNATELLRNGAPLPAVQKMLGHTSMTTTARYLHLLPEDILAAHRLASPVDRLKKQA